MIDRLVQDSYNWFVDIVAERRKFTPLKAKQLADGSIFTGAQGLENGLIDAIGDEKTAKDWLVKERDISKDLETLTWKPVRESDSLIGNPAGIGNAGLSWISERLGLSTTDQTIKAIKEVLPQRLFVDGLISMLHIKTDETSEK